MSTGLVLGGYWVGTGWVLGGTGWVLGEYWVVLDGYWVGTG